MAPLPIVFLQNREPRLTKMPTAAFSRMKTAPPEFGLEDRLAFGQGLRDSLAAPAPALNPEPRKAPAVKTPDANTPRAEVEQQQPTLTTFDAGGHESPPIVTDERRWSLPFNGTDYAIEDLPTTPKDSFQMEIAVSGIANEPASVAAENDRPVVARVPRPKRKAERQKNGPVQPRIVRLETLPPAVQAAILQRQAAAAPPPFPFFLGAPPPPVPQENAPPKKPFLLPESIHDTFKSEY
jgi:hypothetical protein